jgi:hypothetical protein
VLFLPLSKTDIGRHGRNTGFSLRELLGQPLDVLGVGIALADRPNFRQTRTTGPLKKSSTRARLIS